jgi:hypothetical protein
MWFNAQFFVDETAPEAAKKLIERAMLRAKRKIGIASPAIPLVIAAKT